MENPSLHVLSADQLALLNKTWEIPAANPGDSGEAIFYRFFEKHPEHQADFPNFKGLALGDLKGNAKFRSHATKIFNVFTNALASPGAMEDQIKSLADYHTQRNLTNKQKFIDLRVVILEVLCSVCSLDDAGKAAWNAFLDNFYHFLFKYL